MRFIIMILCVIVIASGYLALTTDCRFNTAQLKCSSAEEAEAVEMVIIPEAEYVPEQPPVPPLPEENYSVDDTAEDPDTEDISLEEPETETVEEPKDYSSPNSIEAEIAKVFGPEYRIALAVAKAESKLNPRAVNRNKNGSKDIGVFQINDRHGWDDAELFDWKRNIRIAKDLRDRHGWSQWVAYNNGTYRNFL